MAGNLNVYQSGVNPNVAAMAAAASANRTNQRVAQINANAEVAKAGMYAGAQERQGAREMQVAGMQMANQREISRMQLVDSENTRKAQRDMQNAMFAHDKQMRDDARGFLETQIGADQERWDKYESGQKLRDQAGMTMSALALLTQMRGINQLADNDEKRDQAMINLIRKMGQQRETIESVKGIKGSVETQTGAMLLNFQKAFEGWENWDKDRVASELEGLLGGLTDGRLKWGNLALNPGDELSYLAENGQLKSSDLFALQEVLTTLGIGSKTYLGKMKDSEGPKNPMGELLRQVRGMEAQLDTVSNQTVKNALMEARGMKDLPTNPMSLLADSMELFTDEKNGTVDFTQMDQLLESLLKTSMSKLVELDTDRTYVEPLSQFMGL